MIVKNIFIIIIFLIISFFFFTFFNFNQKYFEITEFQNSFYLIPDNKEGIKIFNLNKKSLHLNELKIDDSNINDNYSLEYSLQLFTSDNYDEILIKYDNLIKNNYIKKELFVVLLNTVLGYEYFLLYKNINRESALDYCFKYLILLDKCIVVNVSNID